MWRKKISFSLGGGHHAFNEPAEKFKYFYLIYIDTAEQELIFLRSFKKREEKGQSNKQ